VRGGEKGMRNPELVATFSALDELAKLEQWEALHRVIINVLREVQTKRDDDDTFRD
jgi:hypothetical protein